jgi:methyl-accepting chemotaxis protein
MIDRLKSGSDEAVKAMNSSQTRSSTTVAEAKAAADALLQIQHSIANIMDMNTLIATATEQQSHVGRDISKRVELISEQSYQSALLANQNRDGSKTLNGKAQDLYEMVDRFSV